MTDKNNMVSINLRKLVKYYLRNWIALCAAVVAGVVVAFVITYFAITPQYQASITVYVNNTAAGQQVDSVSGNNLTAAQKLVVTYVNMLKSNTVLNDVIKRGNLDYTASDIRSMMTASQVDSTEMFTVSISHSNAEVAAHIANTIAEIAPERIAGFVKGSSTEIIDYAETPTAPYKPNYKENLALGGLLGVVLVGIILTCRFLFDMRLKSEEDITNYLNIPVLGSIPLYNDNKRHRGGRYESGSDRKGGNHL